MNTNYQIEHVSGVPSIGCMSCSTTIYGDGPFLSFLAKEAGFVAVATPRYAPEYPAMNFCSTCSVEQVEQLRNDEHFRD